MFECPFPLTIEPSICVKGDALGAARQDIVAQSVLIEIPKQM